MILASPLKAAPGLATASHPHFVGLALLRSLLGHEEVSQNARRSDAVLDMITVLLRQGQAKSVLKAFCQVRVACGPVCYLAIFRLRRWMEQEMMVKVGGNGWEPLKLAFADSRRVIQSYQRQAWEWDASGSKMDDISVTFAWAGVTMDSEEPALQTV